MNPADLTIAPNSVSPELISPRAKAAAFNMADKNGQNESASPAYSVPGVTAATVILGCLTFTTKAAIATATVRPGSDYTASAGNITATSNLVNNTNNQCIFMFAF